MKCKKCKNEYDIEYFNQYKVTGDYLYHKDVCCLCDGTYKKLYKKLSNSRIKPYLTKEIYDYIMSIEKRNHMINELDFYKIINYGGLSLKIFETPLNNLVEIEIYYKKLLELCKKSTFIKK